MVPRMIVPPPPVPPPQPLSATSTAAAARGINARIPRTRVIQHPLSLTSTTPSGPYRIAVGVPAAAAARSLRRLSSGTARDRPRQFLRRRECDRRGARSAAQAREAVGELPGPGVISLAEPSRKHVGEERPPELPSIEPVPPAKGDRSDFASRAALAARWIIAPVPKPEPTPGPAGTCLARFHPERALPQDRHHVLLSRRAAAYEMPFAAQEATQVEVNRSRLRAASPVSRVEDLLGAGRRMPERTVYPPPAVAVQGP